MKRSSYTKVNLLHGKALSAVLRSTNLAQLGRVQRLVGQRLARQELAAKTAQDQGTLETLLHCIDQNQELLRAVDVRIEELMRNDLQSRGAEDSNG